MKNPILKIWRAFGRMIGMAAPVGGDVNDERYWTPFGFGGKTIAGEVVTPTAALGLSAYWACLRIVSTSVAKLPFQVYREMPDGTRQPERGHPLQWVLKTTPNPNTTAYRFVEIMMHWAMSYGNAYAAIVRNGRGEVAQLWQIHPSRVKIYRDPSTYEIYYEVRNDNGTESTIIRQAAMFHLRGPTWDGVCGMSVLEYNAETIGAAMASQKFASAFFGNGITLSGILEHPATLGEEAAKRLAASWHSSFGTAERSNGIAVLEDGMKYHTLGIPPEQAQFLETRQFNVEEICRLFGVPPHKIQHLLRSTFSNIEAQNIEFVGDCLDPWFVSWSQEIKLRLLDPVTERELYVKHNVKALLKGDHAARGAFLSTMRNIGVYSANDIRRMEDEEPIDDPAADMYFIQGAMVPMATAAKSTWNNPSGSASPRDQLEAQKPIFVDAMERVLKRDCAQAVTMAGRSKTIGEYAAWLKTFYQGQESAMWNALAPVLAVNEIKGDECKPIKQAIADWASSSLARWETAYREGNTQKVSDLTMKHRPNELAELFLNLCKKEPSHA